VGPVSVAGLPFSAMQKNILDRMQSIEGVQASITMGELRTIGVFIVGEVRSPGMYTVSALSNVTNALFAAGGPSKSGSLRTIQLKRNGNQIATIDFYDFLLSGKDNTNLRLKSGDVIVVPIVKKMVAVTGNVRRSALYEIKQASSLRDVIALAGGITPAAWTNKIQIERFQNNQFQTVLDVESDKKESLPDFEVQDGDIIKVFPVVIKDENTVFLSGNVFRPGKYEYKKEMKVSDLVPDFQALLPETYFDYAVILRQEPPNFLSRIVPFDLKKAMDDHANAENLQLQPRDVVIIYSRDYFEPDRSVFIGGAITTPGKQKLLENMKIRDLIIKAGGLTEEASTERGELYRRVYTNEIVSTEKIEFNVHGAMDDNPQYNLVLKKSDIIFIRNKKGWEEEKRIALRGEVVYPGDYVLLESETLGSLIDRAGGFTKDAYLPAAIMTRPSVRAFERKRLDEYVSRLQSDALKISTEMMAKQQDPAAVQILLQQQQQLINNLKESETMGRVVIDLTNQGQYKNFILENGDSIFIPKQVGTVSVIGEVFNPATFKFENLGETAEQYVEMAGGFKDNADKKNVYVIKANGSVVTRKSVTIMKYTVFPGDVVVVPQKLEFTNNFKIFMDSIDSIAKIGALLATVVTLAILVHQAKNP
jgi:protein involved in polysaccharide export with SLBB domain